MTKLVVYTHEGAAVTLNPTDHVATGGEGAVYIKDGTVYKIYSDPQKAAAAKIEQKISILKAMAAPGIAAPTGGLWTKSGQFVGITLPVAKGEALCRLYTNTWRDANQFGFDESLKTSMHMRGIMAKVHSFGAVAVDANEMNWLVDGTSACLIDVDSWQVPGFKATAIMPSIRDYSRAEFSPETDWFAWGVVTFQLWTGIHPFKGTHPDFPRNALEARMRANISVFDPAVQVPPAAREVSNIPGALKDWYLQTFSTAIREAPPSSVTPAIGTHSTKALKVTISPSAALSITAKGCVGSKIYAAFNGFIIAKDSSQKLVLWDSKREQLLSDVSAKELALVLTRQAGIVRVGDTVVLATLEPQGFLAVRALDYYNAGVVKIATRATEVWQTGNRLFMLVPQTAAGLHEVAINVWNGRLQAFVEKSWPVNITASKFYRGVVIQDCLGMPFLGVAGIAKSLAQAPAPWLKGYKAIEAFAGDPSHVAITATRKNDGETVYLVAKVEGQAASLVSEELASSPDIDAATLASGLSVIRQGPSLTLIKNGHTRVVPSQGVPTGVRLYATATGLGAFEGNQLFTLALK